MMNSSNKTVSMLLILDGFGIAKAGKGNAISLANTPHLDALFKKYPHGQLLASGTAVGLPKGQMGNSEVGHTNIGAGRVVWQELSRITNDIENRSFFDNEVLKESFLKLKDKQNKGEESALHLMGLLSDGGVHSHIEHLFALLELAKMHELKNVYVHCILDGRDVPPLCGDKYILMLEEKMKELGIGEIASIAGRFYSMDRDKRWDRVKESYDLYTKGIGRTGKDASLLFEMAKENGETDEFVKPSITDAKHVIRSGDHIVFFNFRPDRAREITRCLTEKDFDGFERDIVIDNLDYVCFTQYDAELKNVRIAFPPKSLSNTLGEYISRAGKTQLRIAETEKYAHVTFFFNGGIEKEYENEDRILIPSPKVATYDLKPEMSAYEVTDAVIKAIREKKYDLIVMNLANCDMVGHTGDLEACIKAVEAVDECTGRIAKAIEKVNGKLLLTADHGNADEMLDEEGNVVTAHSVNPVPVLYVDERVVPKGPIMPLIAIRGQHINDGALCDIAPTILEMMELSVPEEMEGKSLLA